MIADKLVYLRGVPVQSRDLFCSGSADAMFYLGSRFTTGVLYVAMLD